MLLVHQYGRPHRGSSYQRSVRFRFWRNSHSSSSSLVKVHHSLVRAHARSDVRVRALEQTRGSCFGSASPSSRPQPARTSNDTAKFPHTARSEGPCGAEEIRTPDFLLAKEALCQLSYGPKSGCAGFGDAAPIERPRSGCEMVVRTGPHAAKPRSA